MNDDIKPIVPPPPRSQRRGLPSMPAPEIPSMPAPEIPELPVQTAAPAPVRTPVPDNMAKPNSGLQDMNFKMPSGFHSAFKIAAAKRNMPMKEMLEASFRCWVDTYGDDDDKKRLPPK